MPGTNITFTLGQLSAVVMGILAFITALGGAIAVIVKGVNKAKAPEKTQNERITKLEERVAKHDELLDNDKRRLDKMEKGHRVTQKALLALLEYGLDPNGNDSRVSLEQAKKDLVEYLME